MKNVNDNLEPIIVFIKECRLQGIDDIEIEQQLLLGEWTEGEMQTGRNFLHLTQKHSPAEGPEVQKLLKKERNFRTNLALRTFIFKRFLSICATVALSIFIGLTFNDF